MKHRRSLFAQLGCMALAALLTLPACTPPVGADRNPPAETHAPDTAPTTELNSAPHAGLAYYEALVAELRQAILDMKQADYITRIEYESRIQALEDELEALGNIPSAGTDIPVSGQPTEPSTDGTPPPADTAPSDSPASMAFGYSITEGQAVITAYLGSQTAVTIPAAIEGYPVTRIADSAFRETAVTSVTLPYSVTHVGWFAFADCQSLLAVTLPASVTSIGYGAFDGSPQVVLRCPADSYAEQYAVSFGMRFTYT